MSLRFKFHRYHLPFRSPVRTAHGPWIEREGVIVRVENAADADTTTAGFGEAAPIPWFGTESVDEVEAGCRALGEWIDERALGNVPEKLGCLRHALASALGNHYAANATAGKQREAEAGRIDSDGPPSSFLSIDPRTCPAHLAVAALLPTGRAALGQIAPKAEVGFRVFKWKVGVAEMADELSLLDDVCAELPSGAKLRLDANGAWDRRHAERWLERCADRPVEFVEQPCFAPPVHGPGAQQRTEDILRGLAEDYPTPIALDESLVGERDLERWIGAGWPGVLVVKPSLIGNLDAALNRLAAAHADVVFSSALETAVGAKFALHAAFAWAARSHRTAPQKTLPADAKNSSEGAAPVAATTVIRHRALGFGVWPLFADARFDGPSAAPFLRYEDVARIDAEAVWTALS
jgi:O-succinylbenzoate synthase